MSDENKPTEDKYTGVEGLKPAYVEGQDPGSAYQVVVRTARAYVGVRRLSKYAYRVRCERFDKKPLLTINDQALMVSLSQMKLKIGKDAIRVSGTFFSQQQASNACAVLTELLLFNDNLLAEIPHCNDEQFIKIDAQIDGQKALKAAAAGDASALNRETDEVLALAPVEPTDDVN